MNSYSNEIKNPFSVEFSEGSNKEMTFISDVDSINGDQIPQLNFEYTHSKPKFLVPVSKDFILIPNSAFSIWQPPQL